MKQVLIACVAVAACAVPGVALSAHQTHAATTYTVYLGEFAQPPASLRKIPGTINQFLPSKLVIAAGDSVTFASNSFHSVTYSPKPIPLLVPDPKKGTYAGLDRCSRDAVLLRRPPEADLQPAGVRAVRAEDDLGGDPRLQRRHGPTGAEVASGNGDLRVPEAGDVPPLLHAASRHEGDGRRQARRLGRAEDARPGEGTGAPAPDGGLPEGDRAEQHQDRRPEHRGDGPRRRGRDDRLLPEGAQGQGRARR